MSIEQFIFTDLPYGKGLDPQKKGFQIQEVSSGLGLELIEQLETISMHYGQAVYNAAPRMALQRETDWRCTTNSIDIVPPDILAAFPPIYSYSQLCEECYALMRTTYLGTTHDKRFGNFLSHALVFKPADLSEHRGNPLAVTRENVFPSPFSVDSKPAIIPDSLGKSVFAKSVFTIFRDNLFCKHVSAFCSAMYNTIVEKRPVIICLSDWKQGLALVEALLCLLPTSARARTTFCTYESDRNWTPRKASAHPQKQSAAHHIVLQCSTDGNPIQLRPDEYQYRNSVFNFTSDQFSAAAAPTPFSHYAAQCVNSDNTDELFVLLEHIESIGRGSDPESWDMFAQLLMDQNSQALAEPIL